MVFSEEQIVESALGKVSFTTRGEGPARVALHSLLTDRAAFDDVAGSVGGRFVAVDLPGFGATEPAGPNIDEYADRVAAFLEATSLDNGEVTLIGNGLGAFVALGAAIRHGNLLDRMILVGCGPGFPEPAKVAFTNMIQAVSTGGMEAVIPIALRRMFTEDYLEAHPELGEARAAVLRRTDPDAFITACNALLGLDYRDVAAAVTTPTLIVVGEDDQATPPQLAEDLHRRIRGSRLTKLPGMAHAPQIQDPEGFTATVADFLEKR